MNCQDTEPDYVETLNEKRKYYGVLIVFSMLYKLLTWNRLKTHVECNIISFKFWNNWLRTNARNGLFLFESIQFRAIMRSGVIEAEQPQNWQKLKEL